MIDLFLSLLCFTPVMMIYLIFPLIADGQLNNLHHVSRRVNSSNDMKCISYSVRAAVRILGELYVVSKNLLAIRYNNDEAIKTFLIQLKTIKYNTTVGSQFNITENLKSYFLPHKHG